jgi:outer membrane protein TolC
VAEQYHAEKLATAQSIQRDVAMSWLDVYEAQRKSELYRRIAEEMAAERKILISRVSSGGSQASEVLRLDGQLSMTNDKRLTAQRDERKSRAALSRWIGATASRPLPIELPVMPGNLSHEAALVEIENHPLIQNAHQTEMVAQSDANLAKAGRQQNWSWEVMYGKRRSDLSDMVTFQVAIDLPWDRANRQDRRTAEKQLLVEKASKLTEDRRHELVAELDSAFADAEAADARDNEHQQRLIPAAQARLSVEQAAYSAGKQTLAEVWEARRDLIDVELEHLAILTDRQRAAVKLGYLLSDSRMYNGSQP